MPFRLVVQYSKQPVQVWIVGFTVQIMIADRLPFGWVIGFIAEFAQAQPENFKLLVTKLVQQFTKEIIGFVQSQAKSFVKLSINFILAEHNLLIRVIQPQPLNPAIGVLNQQEFKIFIGLFIKLILQLIVQLIKQVIKQVQQ